MVSGPVPQKSPESRAFYSSLVVEHIVSKANSADFTTWHYKLRQAAKCHTGFVRWDDYPPLPCEDDVAKWYTIVHFDSPEHLNSWIGSPMRKHFLEEGQAFFRAYRFKSFTTGLEGWFSQAASDDEHRSLGPPAWKQILSVVFGLYPLVMIRLKVFPGAGLIGDWSPSAAMLLATLVTSTLLGTLVMPLLTRLMGFWLYPAYREPRWRTDATGLAIISLGFLAMIALFDFF
ncbi:MAG: hypothetical protein AAFQ74_01180 [Cyanobacteria bacterium J06623_4]